MPIALWDKLLETAYRRGSDLLFIGGSPPLLRTKDCFRNLELPSLSTQGVEALAKEILVETPSSPFAVSDGYTYQDFRHGKVAWFRAMGFGFPNTKLLVIMRLPEDYEESLRDSKLL